MASQIDKYTRRRATTSYISTVIGIALVLSMLGLAALGILSARTISDQVKRNLQVEVILKENADPLKIDELVRIIRSEPYSDTAIFVSKEEALKELQKAIGDTILDPLDGANPLRPSIIVKLKPKYVNPDSLQRKDKNGNEIGIIPTIKAGNEKLIHEVFYDRSMFMSINDMVNTMIIVTLFFAVVLLLIAVALINNTIRLSVYSKRFLIRSMQLVGATNGFIRRPFLGRAILQGLIAGVLAIGFIDGFVYLLLKFFSIFAFVVDFELFAIVFGTLILFGILISWFSTFLALRKYLRINPDDLY
jgi:cell division transport system permease protein